MQDLRKNLDLPALIPGRVDFGMPTEGQSVSIGGGGVRTFPKSFLLDLSAARNNAEVNVAGSIIYADLNPTAGGDCLIAFGDDREKTDPFFVTSGAVVKLSFSRLFITNAAQAGKSLRIFYGSDFDFDAFPVNTDSVPVNNPTTSLAGGFSLSPLTSAIVLAPANNPTGMILNNYSHCGLSNTQDRGPQILLLADTVAPTDGVQYQGFNKRVLKMAIADCVSTQTRFYSNSLNVTDPIYIPPNYGIYLFNQDTLDTNFGWLSMQYSPR